VKLERIFSTESLKWHWRNRPYLGAVWCLLTDHRRSQPGPFRGTYWCYRCMRLIRQRGA
jgi:hypothetical protein